MNIRKRWKRFVGLGILWFIILFPIPVLPTLDIYIPPEAVQAIIIIMIVISIPFILLAIFMK